MSARQPQVLLQVGAVEGQHCFLQREAVHERVEERNGVSGALRDLGARRVCGKVAVRP